MDRVNWEDLGFQEGVDATAKSKHPIPSVPIVIPSTSSIPEAATPTTTK